MCVFFAEFMIKILYALFLVHGMCSVNEAIDSNIDELTIFLRRHCGGDQVAWISVGPTLISMLVFGCHEDS